MSHLAPTRRQAGLKPMIQGHPLTAFLVLTVSFNGAVLTVALLMQRGVLAGESLLGRFGLDVTTVATQVMLVFGLFPAALLVTAVLGGRTAVRALFDRMLRWRV